jgi:hypothetical protein
LLGLMMKLTDLPFFWVLPSWSAFIAICFNAASFYLWKKTGVNMWKFSWSVSFDNIKIEKRFSEELRKFPNLKIVYEALKWGSAIVVLGCLVWVFAWPWRR